MGKPRKKFEPSSAPSPDGEATGKSTRSRQNQPRPLGVSAPPHRKRARTDETIARAAEVPAPSSGTRARPRARALRTTAANTELPPISLTDSVKMAAGRLPGRAKRDAETPAPAAMSLSQSVKLAGAQERTKPSTRADRVGIVVYVSEIVSHTMGRLATEVRTTKSALGEMGFRLLFEKFDEPWPE